MLGRIAQHQQDRLGTDWDTIEEEPDLQRVLREYTDVNILLTDCLTMWISNLIHQNPDISEDELTAICRELIQLNKQRGETIIFVTNEVGSGIVPANSIARKFRDLSGRCNQAIAKGAVEVVFFSCGLPLFLKNEGHSGNTSYP